MKKTILLINLFVASYSFSSAQNASVKGVIFDTINKQSLPNASVSLLRQKDSVLYKVTRGDAKGNFVLRNLLPGNYHLFIAYPSYENYIAYLQLNDTSHIDL